MGGITLGSGRLFVPFGDTVEPLGYVTELESCEDIAPEWPAVNPFLQMQKEATLTMKAFINMRELQRLIYGRKRWRNKLKAVRMMDLKRRRREALREKIRRAYGL